MSAAMLPPAGPAGTALYLMFRMDNDYYAIAATEIRRVLKRQRLKQIPSLPAWVAGVLEFEQQMVPVIDLYQRLLQRPASEKSSTRLVIVRYDEQHALGLLLEKVNTFERLSLQGRMDVTMNLQDHRYLAAVQQHESLGLVQHVALAQLLPADVRARIFAAVASLSAEGAAASLSGGEAAL